MLFTVLASLSAAIAAFCVFLLLFDLFRMIEIEKQEDEMHEYLRLPLFFRLFLPLVSNVRFLSDASFLEPSRRQTEELIQMASLDQAVSGARFFALKVFMVFFGFVIFLLFALGGNGLSGLLLWFALACYPSVWLKKIVAKRHLSILKSLPNVLDLLTLSVEAGKDFLTALRDILARRKNDPLGEELSRALHEIQLGKSRTVALKEMSDRVRQPELASVVNAIVQADELGVSIGQLLRLQGDQLRNKRFVRAEKLANEAPVKILFPVVVFIFPCVFIILIGPIAYEAMRTLS